MSNEQTTATHGRRDTGQRTDRRTAPGDPGEVESGGADRRTRQLLTLAWFRAWFLFVLRSRYVYHRAGCAPPSVRYPLHRGYRRRRAVGE